MALEALVAMAFQEGPKESLTKDPGNGEGHASGPASASTWSARHPVSAQGSQHPSSPRICPQQEEFCPAAWETGRAVDPEIGTAPEICSHLNWPRGDPQLMSHIKITQKLEQD